MLGFRLRFFLQFIFLVFSATLFSQLRPPIKNFTSVDYNGENQNWDISQASSNHIYVANSKGLLEFNGAVWNLYPSPNESIMRSVKFVNGRIYTGCYMEFGYWKRDDFGVLNYTSLSKNLDIPLVEDEEFWNILELGDLIVFQSKKRIYIYNITNNTFKTIDSDNTITNIAKIGETIYFQKIGEGVFRIEYGADTLVSADPILRANEIINIFQKGNDLLILTQGEGFFDLKDGILTKSNMSSNEFLATLTFYDGIKSKNGYFVLGTISNGVVYVNENGDFLNQISLNNGLLNNTVLSVFEDVQSNIWLGLDNGISYLNTKSPYRVFNDDKGVLGSVYVAEIKNEILYLGTNQGLFYKRLDSFENFKFVKGTKGQVWSLKNINGMLFCAHHSGTFLINNGLATKVANIPGTWDIALLDDNSNFLLQGNYDGLYVLEKSDEGIWALRNKIEGFKNSSRYFETIETTILVNHEYNGVFKLKVDSLFQRVENFSEDRSLKGANSGMVKYKGEILYSYKKGIYVYKEVEEKFKKDTLFSKLYAEEDYESGKLIFDEKKDVLWAFTKSGINFLEYEPLTNTPKINNIALTKDIRNGILGYENILSLGNNKYLMGTTSGFLTTNLNEVVPRKFEIFLDYVSVVKQGGSRKIMYNSEEGDFLADEKNIEIAYYTPEFNKFFDTEYQFKLDGMYNSWSDWTKDHTISFENLPYGKYTFNVRSKIGKELSLNTATYSFKIAKPWYISNTMVVFYILGILLFSFLMHNIYQGYYKKQRQKLIEKNRKELEFAQIQSEKEIIRIKNQKLEAEFKGKSKELAASTMNIIKKNELLTKIKNELSPIKDREAIKPVIQVINENLNQDDDWELFQEAFNNADSKFLKKIKKVHPKLSPNDLKLCAYLRLNLSSKEIAQLLNISPRSVEIKRYRLRKKLNLQHEDNLVNYILTI
ncbi:helix-turn-helix and ligand-binding sensor domain-containing protein [Croceitalea rosinachiae]|uniref:Triple tyrosine motif-containing protein n=1 Tax=Croceitalea rosinachiae TaxID=3075596 RepID=A0ABU3AF02_9FLAO|nr:triple tyrosine motif-containing protein [Croceitalea sp. F388]MDT0608117.1 triple tyrosine motif-containing protein [Croceitalea sp. F388]